MATLTVEAHPKSSRSRVELRNGIYHVYVHSAPEKGKANNEIQKLLAEHLKVPRVKLRCIKGEHSRHKIFELLP